MTDGKKRLDISKILRLTFGTLMIAVYLGMGFLMLSNYFKIQNAFVPNFLGILFIVYGIFRGYRQYKGLDYNKH